MRMPHWFFTRASGFALLLMTLVFADVCWQILRANLDDSGAPILAGVVFMLGAVGLVLGAQLWLIEFDEPHDYDDWRPVRWAVYATQAATAWIFHGALHDSGWPVLAVLVVSFGVITVQAARRSVPVPGERRRGEPRREAWLVITINLKTEPPVVSRAAIFSCKASGLTSISRDELNVDVDYGEGDSYEKARAHLLHHAPLHYPGLTPLLRKSGEDL